MLVLALLGAAAAAAYGYFVLSMRLGPPLVMVGLGGMTLALCAAALWRVIDPLTRGEISAVAEIRAPHRIRELEREKQAVLKAIKEVELDYQMRKISEPDYREMVERYRTRALRIMGDLALGDDIRGLIERELKGRLAARTAAGAVHAGGERSGSGPGEGDGDGGATKEAVAGGTAANTLASTTSCPACATINDTDAAYCKKCGRPLSSPAVPV